jgi:hypothetical protein
MIEIDGRFLERGLAGLSFAHASPEFCESDEPAGVPLLTSVAAKLYRPAGYLGVDHPDRAWLREQRGGQFKTDPREDCVQMPAKMDRFAARLPFGFCGELSAPRGCLAGRPEIREYSRQIESHLGNPGRNVGVIRSIRSSFIRKRDQEPGSLRPGHAGFRSRCPWCCDADYHQQGARHVARNRAIPQSRRGTVRS